MESILFSLNSVMPLFLMGIAGYLLVQRGVVNENFVDQASNLCFKLLIPFSLFREALPAPRLRSGQGRRIAPNARSAPVPPRSGALPPC